MAAPDIGSCLSAGIDGLKKNPLAHIVSVVLVGAVAYLIALPTFFSVLMPLQSGRPAAA